MKCFHHTDIDGKCAGAMVARYTDNYDKNNYIPYNYDGDIPIDSVQDGEDVYFVDLSFSDKSIKTIEELMAKNCKIHWCDHHETSMKFLEEHPEYNDIDGIRDKRESGCMLTWAYFNNCPVEECGKKAPEFLKLISDFDCWHMVFEDSIPFKDYIESLNHEPTDMIWNRFMKNHYRGVPDVEEAVSEGRIIQRHEMKTYEAIRKANAYESVIKYGDKEMKCYVINNNGSSLLFGDDIYNHDLVAIWHFDGEKYHYSIYSENPDVDCSVIAKQFGGGGHRGAAGFLLPEMILIKQ